MGVISGGQAACPDARECAESQFLCRCATGSSLIPVYWSSETGDGLENGSV